MSTPAEQRDGLLKACQVLLLKPKFSQEDRSRYDAMMAMVALLERQAVGAENGDK
jgi:hypothetical protein